MSHYWCYIAVHAQRDNVSKPYMCQVITIKFALVDSVQQPFAVNFQLMPQFSQFDMIMSALVCSCSNAKHLPVQFYRSPIYLTNQHNSNFHGFLICQIFIFIGGLDVYIKKIITKYPEKQGKYIFRNYTLLQKANITI